MSRSAQTADRSNGWTELSRFQFGNNFIPTINFLYGFPQNKQSTHF